MLTGGRQEIFQAGVLVSDPLEPLPAARFAVATVPADQSEVPEGVPEAVAHPLVVYAAVAAAVLWVLARAAATVAGPVSEALTKLRTHRQQSEDARIRDLSSQVDHLMGEVAVLRERLTVLDRHLIAHAEWDRQLLQHAIARGLDADDIGPPPPLWPTME